MNFLRKSWMTDREFRANSQGLNIVFGAVLGFVLAGTEDLNAGIYSVILISSVAAVVTILYIGASVYRKTYATFAVVYTFLFPTILDHVASVEIPPKLQSTLLIWAIFAIVLEFVPRDRSTKPDIG